MQFPKTNPLFLAALLIAVSKSFASTPDAAGIEFFEKNIRPIFVENCYKCHSQESGKDKGGMMLDTRERMLKGGDSGPAIVPGHPDKSLFIKAVRYTDDNLRMPPKGKKLLPEQIAVLEEWVKMGAPDPRESPKAGTLADGRNAGSIAEQAKNHWAFQPVKNPPAPEVKNKRWARTQTDLYILAKLEAKNMRPSPQADKRTLIRRATFDLTGLPPTHEEVVAFEKDRSADAFAKVVDRLLASPRYGERWGRHWLDVARYADTMGYMFEQERRYPYAYTYRDYVIRAFNEDLPYDQFIIHQLAADQLQLGEDKRPLAAMGFLTVGRRFLNNQNDIIDDRIDVTSRGFMGLTVSCARCHDHKYDPIPTKDYYSLYGVFASSHEPAEKPTLGINPPKYDEYLAEKKRLEADLEKYKVDQQDQALAGLRKRIADYLLVARELPLISDQAKKDAFVLDRKVDNGVAHRWISTLEAAGKTNHTVFAPWIAFAALSETNFAEKAKELSEKFTANSDKEKPLNPLVAQLFTNAPASLTNVAEAYEKLFHRTDKRWQEALEAGKTNPQAPSVLADANWEELRQLLYANDAPPNLPRPELERLYRVEVGQTIRAKIRDIEGLASTHPGAPPRAMAMEDKSNPYDPKVFIRGNAGNPGPEVPRQFLLALAGENRKPFQKGSGRLEMAQAIASKTNPLTARVMVNRVWLHHFGKGIVGTPSDFGLRSETPVHLELLDSLAWRFMENGWSLKKLHREIMLSAVYQQTSDDNEAYAKLDPNNHLHWKMNRQRLEFEAMRDSLLAVSGKLDLTMEGRSVDIVEKPFSPRRSVYGYIDRQNLPGLFRTFDFANPDASSAQRFFTTVPQQALFLLNSPFVVQQAGNLLTNLNEKKIKQDKDKIEYLHTKVFQREPDKEEIRLGEQFIKKQITMGSMPPNASAWRYGYGEYDEKTKRLKSFTEFPHFTDNRWQNSAAFPDPQLAYANVNREGGHPGNHNHHSVVRRWIAPFDGIVKIEGELFHIMDKGDGVRGRAVSSRTGLVAEWVSFNQKIETAVLKCEVRRGDTIDFITDAQSGPAHDTFKWAPVVKVAEVKYGTPPPAKTDWNATRDFDGPPADTRPMTAWEKYAQALLLSNEFVFVD